MTSVALPRIDIAVGMPATSRVSGSSMVDRRAAPAFWRLSRAGWRQIAARTWRETGEDNISLLAAGVAFYSFLAFVPLLASIVLVYGIAVTPSDVAAQMQTLMRIVPGDVAKVIGDQLKTLTETPVTRTAIGLALALLVAVYGAMRGATSIIGALNIAYGEKERRGFFHTTALSFAFTFGAVLAAVITMAAISAMSLLDSLIHLPPLAAPLITAGLWIGTGLIASILVAIVYRYGPDRKNAAWVWLTPGVALASFGSLLSSFLFGLYVANFADYNATYGALGAVVSFLMWLYVTAYVVLLGAELNAEVDVQIAKEAADAMSAGQVRTARMGGGSREGDKGDVAGACDHAGEGFTTRSPEIADRAELSRGPTIAAPIAAGLVATRAVRWFGGVPVGTVSMTLLSSGIAIVGRKGKTGLGLLYLAAGGALVLRAQWVANHGPAQLESGNGICEGT